MEKLIDIHTYIYTCTYTPMHTHTYSLYKHTKFHCQTGKKKLCQMWSEYWHLHG